MPQAASPVFGLAGSSGKWIRNLAASQSWRQQDIGRAGAYLRANVETLSSCKASDAEAMAALPYRESVEVEAVAESGEKVGEACDSVCSQSRRSGLLLAPDGLTLV